MKHFFFQIATPFFTTFFFFRIALQPPRSTYIYDATGQTKHTVDVTTSSLIIRRRTRSVRMHVCAPFCVRLWHSILRLPAHVLPTSSTYVRRGLVRGSGREGGREDACTHVLPRWIMISFALFPCALADVFNIPLAVAASCWPRRETGRGEPFLWFTCKRGRILAVVFGHTSL